MSRYAAVAMLLVFAGCQGDPPTETGSPGEPANLLVVGGNDQTGLAGDDLSQALMVRVRDGHGRAVPGIEVAWRADRDNALLCAPGAACSGEPVRTTTDGEGLAWIIYRALRIGAGGAIASVESRQGLHLEAGFSAKIDGLLIGLSTADCSDNEAAEPGFHDATGSNSSVVPAGSRVVWELIEGCFGVIESVSLPPGGMSFLSEPLARGSRFTIVPEAPGIWDYKDRGSGWTGRLWVTGSAPEDEPDPSPASLDLISGNSQEGLAGSALDQRLIVRVTNRDGRGVESVPVLWEVTGAAAVCAPTVDACHLTEVPTFTDPLGYASVWVHFFGLGSAQLKASVANLKGSPAGFVATATGVLMRFERLDDCAGGSGETVRFRSPVGQSDVTVPVGTPVVWEFYATDICSARIHSTVMPEGGEAFDSEDLDVWQRFSFTPKVTGMWEFIEEYSGTKGRLFVTTQ